MRFLIQLLVSKPGLHPINYQYPLSDK